jgi:hypothetical protein
MNAAGEVVAAWDSDAEVYARFISARGELGVTQRRSCSS